MEGFRKFTPLESELRAIRDRGAKEGRTPAEIETEITAFKEKFVKANQQAKEGPDNVIEL